MKRLMCTFVFSTLYFILDVCSLFDHIPKQFRSRTVPLPNHPAWLCVFSNSEGVCRTLVKLFLANMTPAATTTAGLCSHPLPKSDNSARPLVFSGRTRHVFYTHRYYIRIVYIVLRVKLRRHLNVLHMPSS